MITKLKQILRVLRNLFRRRGLKIFFNFKEEYIRARIALKNINRKKKVGRRFLKNKANYKKALFRHDGNKCFWCGEKMKQNDATIDHIIPISAGGRSTFDNLRLIHDKCRLERDALIIETSGDIGSKCVYSC